MSQPGNYRYQSYDQAGTPKSRPVPMVNGQPSTMQHIQNGVQPPSFNSAGTPSSQSSRDPSREPSRDPSPTQYLHNQYRPQLTRPPMPPINGQQQMSMSQQPPRSQQTSQSTPVPNSQNTNQFPSVQGQNPSAYPTSQLQSPISAHSLSSDTQTLTNQSQTNLTPTRYDRPPPQASQAAVENRPSPIFQGQTSGGQNLPPTTNQSSIPGQLNLNKDNAPSPNNPPATTMFSQTWRNQGTENNSNNSQPTIPSQSNLVSPSWNKETSSIPSSQPNSSNQSVTTTSSNDTQIPQSHGVFHISSTVVTRAQNTNVAPPTSLTSAQNTTYPQQSQALTNKQNIGNPVNLRSSQGPQSSPTMTGMSTQNVFGQTSQGSSQKSQNPQISYSSLAKPQPQYPTSQQTNLGNQGNYPTSTAIPASFSTSATSQASFATSTTISTVNSSIFPTPGGNPSTFSTAGRNPPSFTTTGANPLNFSTSVANQSSVVPPGVNPAVFTSSMPNPTNFSTPGGNPSIFSTQAVKPPNFSTTGVNPATFSTSTAKPPAFSSMGANPTQFSTSGANQTIFSSSGVNPPTFSTPTAIPPTFPTPSANPTNYPSAPGNAATFSSPGANPTNLAAPGGNPSNLASSATSQLNQNAYSQQNVASQRKYPQPQYAQMPVAGNMPAKTVGMSSGPPAQVPRPPPGNIPGSHPIAAKTTGIPPGPPGQVPRPPPATMGTSQPEAHYDYRTPYFGQMSNVPLDNMAKRYPTSSYPDQNQLNAQMGNLNVTQSGFNALWEQQSVDLLQCRNVLPPEKVEPPKIKLHQEFLDSVNCSPEIFRCTLTKIPESNSLLQKCRMPLGVLIHPFKDLNHLPVIQCSTIVRCRACRTYINPFVYFVDSKRWKCNLCYRVNDLPEEFQFDPVTKSYGDPSRRPEVKTSTIEFIAPSEYMLRPPQPAVYLFLLDVSRLAVDSGYLGIVCETIADELTKLPGDGRTQVGFIAIDSSVHFFSMPENVSQPHELVMLDVDDVFLPCPDNLIVNLKEREELVRDLLEQLPSKFNGTHDTNSALGAGLQAAFKLMSPTGGRVTVFQTCLPNVGPGALTPREDPNTRASKDVPHLNPATDFYKRLALDCSGQQIAVDLFLLNSQYSDLATLSGMCKFSGGCMYHIPLFRHNKPQHSETLEKMLRRYLTRKIGFEAVMRIRCTRGLSIHTFHGNFFVRSTDLLSLPNVNPDAGFGMQVSIDENLSDVQTVCFQAALLYTSSKGERRIRVHTLCLPVSSSMTDILYSADQQAIVGLVSKMAVDRSQQSSLSDARDAFINVAIDALSAYKLSQSTSTGGLLAPGNLKLLPLYIIAMIKCLAFRSGTSTRLDDRIYSMCQMKSLPLGQMMQMIYPDLYPVHTLDDRNSKDIEGKICPQAPRIHLSAEKLDFRGVFLMDAGDKIYIYVGKSVDTIFCNNVLGVAAFASMPEEFYDLPELDTVESERLRNFVFSLQEEKPYYAPLQIIREDSHFRSLFTDRLIEDRFESALSYYEFLQHLKTQVK